MGFSISMETLRHFATQALLGGGIIGAVTLFSLYLKARAAR
jgi:hypothetical protein